jgi:hypothetical protein
MKIDRSNSISCVGRVRVTLVALAAVLVACGDLSPSAAPNASAAVSKTAERGPSDFTGTFMADNRPYWMGWLALTQSGVTVTGSMITVDPDGKGGTKADTETVTGTTDGGLAVSLTTGSVLGTTGSTFNGRRNKDDVTLTWADKTGKIQSAVYRAAARDGFNSALGAWQAQLAGAKADADRTAAEQKAIADRNAALAQAVRARSSELQDALSGMATGTTNRKNGITSASTYVAAERTALTTLQANLTKVQTDAKEPLDYYKACFTVRYDYEDTMGYTFDSTLGYQRDRFADISKDLTTNLGFVDQRVTEAQKAVGALAAAIAASPLRVTGVLAPGDEKATIDAYRATAATVTTQLADLRTQDSALYTAAQNLMAQGLAVWNTVKTSHRCT